MQFLSLVGEPYMGKHKEKLVAINVPASETFLEVTWEDDYQKCYWISKHALK
jgi:hypothetical protein